VPSAVNSPAISGFGATLRSMRAFSERKSTATLAVPMAEVEPSVRRRPPAARRCAAVSSMLAVNKLSACSRWSFVEKATAVSIT